jgi:hypothetical protein
MKTEEDYKGIEQLFGGLRNQCCMDFFVPKFKCSVCAARKIIACGVLVDHRYYTCPLL